MITSNFQKKCCLFFDFDGTVYVNKKIAKETKSAMLAAQRAGHKLILNTARAYGEAILVPALFEIPWDGFIFGASDIRFEGRTLFFRTIPVEDAVQWMRYGIQYHLSIVYGGRERAVFYDFKNHIEPFSEEEICETVAAFRAETEVNPLTKMMLLNLPSEPFPKTEQTVILQQYADIFPNGCNKGDAIRIFCREARVSIEQCVCFGDSPNDVDMFKVCPTSVCMKPSPEELIRLATYHATTDLGVAEGLQVLFGIS